MLPTVGGGWHANHHDWPAHYTTSNVWWQIDPGGVVVRALGWLGLASDLRGTGARNNVRR